MGRPPVYCDIADDVRAMILRRELIDGTALADDEHLAINYRVSPMTVRRAMLILRSENLIERDCGRWIVRQAEPITRLYRVLDALDVGDQPDPPAWSSACGGSAEPRTDPPTHQPSPTPDHSQPQHPWPALAISNQFRIRTILPNGNERPTRWISRSVASVLAGDVSKSDTLRLTLRPSSL